ncbi:type III PLP-dependent enzyme [Pseudooceanicola aestuarii]|uniref:type III PLP-dependent enzyme n=1 Tax=Pseudooceanicola aestuarii TaxID=2697319 RepID=UPI0013D8D42D|nr:type III PLP-dependent enzyme [Pseudooceanicola aestuarii]
MTRHHALSHPEAHLAQIRPDHPIPYFCPAELQATARRFQAGFPGLVTYAVKANPERVVLDNLRAAGITAYDVASPVEMRLVRQAAPDAALHYNNPVRSAAEIGQAAQFAVSSASVDDGAGLRAVAPLGCEVAVRFKLSVTGAAYDFGSKFGAEPQQAVALLAEVGRRGLTPALTFHPGTQCEDAAAWESYIRAAADIARAAGVRLARLNVGGGFPAHRTGPAPDLEAILTRIAAACATAFGPQAPALVCEPGRAMVASSVCLATRVKALRDGGAVVLNDGLYGGLSELRDIAVTDRIRVITPEGLPRTGARRPRVIFGPTCDSVDRLPGMPELPGDLAVDDYVLFDGMGAYGHAIATGFNGYGPGPTVSVARF